MFVGRAGVEPACLAALAPKASASASFATCPSKAFYPTSFRNENQPAEAG
jgi:hypothetical protein